MQNTWKSKKNSSIIFLSSWYKIYMNPSYLFMKRHTEILIIINYLAENLFLSNQNTHIKRYVISQTIIYVFDVVTYHKSKDRFVIEPWQQLIILALIIINNEVLYNLWPNVFSHILLHSMNLMFFFFFLKCGLGVKRDFFLYDFIYLIIEIDWYWQWYRFRFLLNQSFLNSFDDFCKSFIFFYFYQTNFVIIIWYIKLYMIINHQKTVISYKILWINKCF